MTIAPKSTIPEPITPKPFSPNAAMSTRAFLKALSSAGERELRFMLGGELLVAAGFHVTEVKALAYHAMDCGGQEAKWRETHVQLWNPEPAESQDFMRADKFLAIYGRVARSVPAADDAELRIEYGTPSQPTVTYPIATLELLEQQLLVHLRVPAVTCKARDRRLEHQGCCTSSETPGADVTPTAPAGQSCC